LYRFGTNIRLALFDLTIIKKVLIKTGGLLERMKFDLVTKQHLGGNNLMELTSEKLAVHRKISSSALNM